MAEPDWWRQWTPALDAGPIADATVVAMRAQPGFAEAMAQALRGLMRLTEADAEFNRTMPDMESMVLGMLVLYLDATGGLTHRRLRDIAATPGVFSGGRVSALLLRLRMIGFLSADGDHRPGTPKVYRPTARMTLTFRTWVRTMLEALQQMAPEPPDLPLRLDDPERFRAYMAVLGQFSLDAEIRPNAATPGQRSPMSDLGTRRGGNAVMFMLLDAASRGAPTLPAQAPVKVSVTDLAARCRVSRTQIIRILRDVEAAGFLTRGMGEGDGEVQPALLHGLEEVFAKIFITMGASAGRALVERAPARQPTA